MNTRDVSTANRSLLIGVIAILGSSWALSAFASDGERRATAAQHKPQMHEAIAPQSRKNTNALVKTVRDATRRFRDPAQAAAEGYELHFGCVSGSHEGAMGLHLVNLPLVADGILDPNQPELLLYEPLPNGKMRLTGADYLVFKEDWDAANATPPQLMGQLFHMFESPNRYGLPAFYTLHVWAWKENPSGTFANWNPNVSCDAFNPSNTM